MGLFSFRNVVTFSAGAAAGYFLGSREGRRQAEELARQAQQFWTDPKTQEQVHNVTEKVTEAVKEKAPALSDAAETAAGFVDQSTGYSASKDQDLNSDVTGNSNTPGTSTTGNTTPGTSSQN